jgi:nitrate reductase NapAB chaperone NapD
LIVLFDESRVAIFQAKFTDSEKERSMPVFSYVAYPVQGAKEELLNDLAALDHCEVMPAENEEILILVTDTPDEEKEKELQKKLKDLKSLQSLGMTFGHTDE